MKITGVNVFSVPFPPTPSAGRQNAWIVEMTTDEGVTGIGEIGLCYGIGGRGAAQIVLDLAENLLLGADPRNIERLHNKLVRTTFWGLSGGAVYMAAVSALDEALWDIKGKMLNAPIYELLGGAASEQLRLYANGWYRGLGAPEAYGESAAKVVGDGFTALKFDPFKANLDGTAAHPHRQLGSALRDLALARVAKVREMAPDTEIILEFHGNLWPKDAIDFGLVAEQFRPAFYEEVVEPLNVQATAEVAAAVTVPLAGGERLWSRHGFRQFFEAGAMQLAQPDMGVAGGFTEVRRIASLAESFCAYLQPHNCGGPISTAACVQMSAACSNFYFQEIFPYWEDGRYDIVEDPYERDIKNGYLSLRRKPGLGVTLNHDYLSRFNMMSVKI